MQSIIITTFSVLVSLWNYKHFDSFMASKLFKAQHGRAWAASNRLGGSQRASMRFIQPSRFCNIGHYLMDTIPARCRCCRKSRLQRSLDRALKIMDEEINIVEIVKSRRYFKTAL